MLFKSSLAQFFVVLTTLAILIASSVVREDHGLDVNDYIKDSLKVAKTSLLNFFEFINNLMRHVWNSAFKRNSTKPHVRQVQFSKSDLKEEVHSDQDSDFVRPIIPYEKKKEAGRIEAAWKAVAFTAACFFIIMAIMALVNLCVSRRNRKNNSTAKEQSPPPYSTVVQFDRDGIHYCDDGSRNCAISDPPTVLEWSPT
ncbi:hypothetical protein ACOME3_007874 [Neoechinorhynchus agilis]